MRPSLDFYYRISSPISLVIFSVFDTEICELFHQKRGSAYSRGFGIKKSCWIRWFYFFFGQHESVWRSLNIRVSAYSRDRLIGEEIRYPVSSVYERKNFCFHVISDFWYILVFSAMNWSFEISRRSYPNWLNRDPMVSNESCFTVVLVSVNTFESL